MWENGCIRKLLAKIREGSSFKPAEHKSDEFNDFQM